MLRLNLGSNHLSLMTVLAAAALIGCQDATGPRRVAPAAAAYDLASAPILETFYGPERFTRGKGAPETFTRQIPTVGFEAPFVLHVSSGDASGANRVSSATVRLDGTTMLAPSAFNQQQGEWSIPVTLGSTAKLSVTLASAPGGYLDIWIEGKRSATLFCPDGRAGSVTDLRQAIVQTPPGGTVLVCDGLHLVDTVLIDKPLTLRSQNPGGATLGDAESGGNATSGTPIIRIDKVASGLVRIADIAIAVTDQGIRPLGTFDQVEIDSVHFSGVPGASNVAVVIGATTVTGARVEVTNSDFSQLQLGVWPVNAVETNIRNSRFDRFSGGAADYSNGNTATTQSFGRIEDNVFTNCGPSGCIRVLTTGAVLVARNQLQAMNQPMASGSYGAITVMAGIVDPNAAPKIIEDNVITSARTSSPEMTPQGWMFQTGIWVGDQNTVTHVVRRNRITNVYSGLTATANVSAMDNTFNGGVYAFQQITARAVTFQRNDAVGLLSSFTAPNTGGNYQCNWWGSASGPVTPPGNVATSTYAPWATQPIAGTSVSCDPAAAIMAVRVCSTAVDGGPMTAATFSQAYNLVAVGGTISFCAGTHMVSNASIDKPLTVTSESGAMATLDGGSGPGGQVFFVGNVTPGGTVNISRLQFFGGMYSNVFLGNNAGNVNVSSNEFHPPQTGPYGGTVGWLSGLQLGGTGMGAVNVVDNTFVDGDVGFHINSPSGSPTLRGNTFLNQNNSSIHIAGPRPGPIVIERNTFRGCGTNWCLFTQHGVTAVGNTIEIPTGRSTYAPLRIDNFSGGTSVVSDNVITGLFSGADRGLDANYSIRGRAIQVYGDGRIDRNRITYAYNGIGASNATLTGGDNVIEHTYAPFASGGSPSSSTIAMTRNDLLDYVVTLDASWAFSAVNLTCNYWGSASGPTGITGSSSWYTPFSKQPIANQLGVVCP